MWYAFALPTLGSPLAMAVTAGYLAAGVATAAVLARRGQPAATIAAAVPCWPLLLPLVGPAERPRSRGPLAERIDEGFRSLAATLADPSAGDAPVEDLDGLHASLLRADERLALVDRLLADPRAAAAPGAETLREARAHVAAEIEAVLAEVVALRIQVGLQALAGDAAPVSERLRALQMRLAALEEVSK
jgi:hypothetical protein